MVVDAVILHWGRVLSAMEAGAEGHGPSVQDLAACFYTDDVLVASTQLERLQRAFDVLTYHFDRFGFRTNT